MRIKKGQHNVDVIFVMMVVCIFAICSLFVILLGGQVYRNIQMRTEQNFETRTGISYLMNKIRSYDGKASVLMVERVSQKGLTIQSGGYHTYIYYSDGALREYTADAGMAFDPSLGETIATASGLEFTMNERVLTITITEASGEKTECSLALRSAEIKEGVS